MEVTNTMGAGELVRKYLESDAGSDLLAEMVKMAAELLMDADVDLALRGRLRRAHRGAGSTAATGTGRGAGTPGPGRSTWRSPSCARAATCPLCSSRAGGPNRPWSAWSARPTSRASRPGGSTTWCAPWGSTGCPSPRSQSWPRTSTPGWPSSATAPSTPAPTPTSGSTPCSTRSERVAASSAWRRSSPRGQRGGSPRDPGRRRLHHRGRGGLDGLLARPGGPGAAAGWPW